MLNVSSESNFERLRLAMLVPQVSVSFHAQCAAVLMGPSQRETVGMSALCSIQRIFCAWGPSLSSKSSFMSRSGRESLNAFGSRIALD